MSCGTSRSCSGTTRNAPTAASARLSSPSKLVDSVAINDQFALVAARQVEVAHQAVPRIVFIPVARVVHARPFVAAIPRVVFARITPSSIGHRSLRCLRAAVWVVREDALAVAARGGSGSSEAPGRCAATFGAGRVEPRLGAAEGDRAVVQPVAFSTATDQQPTVLPPSLYALPRETTREGRSDESSAVGSAVLSVSLQKRTRVPIQYVAGAPGA